MTLSVTVPVTDPLVAASAAVGRMAADGYSRRKRGKRADQGARDSPHRPTTPHAAAAIARAVLLIACSRCRMAVASTAATCVGVRAFAAEAA